LCFDLERKSWVASFSRWALKPGLGQVDVALDPAQGLVVDGFFVVYFNHGI
jgi:hypothetical protein